MMNDQWQDNLRDRMKGHEEPAPEGVWEGIEQRFTAGRMGGVLNRNRKLRVWGRCIGAMAVVAAVATMLLLTVWRSPSDNQPDAVFTGKSTPITPQQEQPIAETGMTDKEAPVTLSRGSQPVSKRQPSFHVPDILLAGSRDEEITGTEWENENRAGQAGENDDNAGPPAAKEAINPEPEKTSEDFTGQDQNQSALDFNKSGDPLFAMSLPGRPPDHSRWQTNLSVSNVPSGAAETYSGYGTFALTETVEEQYGFISNHIREQVYTDVEHHQPVTFGFTLRYNFNERWSVASGLTYTQLSSELRSGSGNYYYNDRQTLHYLGVPLNVAYTIWQNPKIATYLSAGELVEKNVAGRLSSDYYLDNELEISTREKISSKELQWSVNTAIGLEYQISHYIGLYAEPGIAWYFKNGSALETIYKDDPFHFNLRLGLRFTLGD